MKKLFIFGIGLLVSLQMSAQAWVAGTNEMHLNSDSVNIGIGISNPQAKLHINNGFLRIGNTSVASARARNMIKIGDGDYIRIGEWEADDMLSFKATRYNFTNGNVGIGITPTHKLHVNGEVYIEPTVTQGWKETYLRWFGHSLIMGSPVGNYAYNAVDLRPGGSTQGEVYSRFRMYTATAENVYDQKVEINSGGICWFNAGNFGIGTTTPAYTLDVNGTIRANEIIVNIPSGADFVFEEQYPLRSLNEVGAYISEHKHLPEIPSAADMEQNGVNVNELQIKLLQKIEELTLYVIQQQETIKALQDKVNVLSK